MADIKKLIAKATHAYGVWDDSRVWESRLESDEAKKARKDAQARIAREVLRALQEAGQAIAARMSRRGVNFRNTKPYAVGRVLGVKLYRCLDVTTPREEFIEALAEVVRRAGGDDRQFVVERLAHEVEAAIWPHLGVQDTLYYDAAFAS